MLGAADELSELFVLFGLLAPDPLVVLVRDELRDVCVKDAWFDSYGHLSPDSLLFIESTEASLPIATKLRS